MGLSDIQRGHVLAAVSEHDRLGRDEFLGRHGLGRATKFLLLHNGRTYDSKAILRVAHGYARPGVAATFPGGRQTVVPRLQALGFEVVGGDEPTSPAWAMDELMLALHLYLSHPGRNFRISDPDVVALSEELRALTVFSASVRESPGFRTPSAVKLKMANFSSLDPARTGKGLDRVGEGDRVAWTTWADRREELEEAVRVLRGAGNLDEPLTDTREDEEASAEEGRILYRLHRRRERDRELVRKKKAEVLRKDGVLRCEACGLEARAVYGEVAADCVDVHHVAPLHVVGESTTRLSDLAILCPTCHRVLHRHRPIITPAELRRRLAERAGE